MKPIYLDHAATTSVDPEVLATMLPYFGETYGNPSSLHSFGQSAKQAMEETRETIASFLHARPGEIVFTSGGTESDNFAVKGIAYARKHQGNHIITSRIEHHAVLEPCHFLEEQGFRVSYLSVDAKGFVDPADVERAITDQTILVSIMHANNEIGTIQPIEEIGEIARRHGITFHTDAVQTFGHLPLNMDSLPVDLLSASAHKLYGPKGIGILYIRQGTRIHSFMHGGDQERNRRGSTHNLPGIVGMGKAVMLAMETMEGERSRLASLRDRLISGVLKNIADVRLNGDSVRRLPGNVNISIGYAEGESLLLKLDMEGVACSTGSACTSSSLEPSHVLAAIGLPPEVARGSLRFTLGKSTTQEDIDHVIGILPPIVEELRNMSPLYKGKES